MSNARKKKSNTSELERYISELEENKRKSRRDTTLLAFLIIIGMIGLTYVLSNPQPSTGKDVITFEDDREHSTNPSTSDEKPQPKKVSIESLLLIEGEREANEAIKFIITSFDKRVNYQIDYGDGKLVNANRKVNIYKYPIAGKYNIKLYSTYNGRTKKLHTQQILINTAIEVGDNVLIDRTY